MLVNFSSKLPSFSSRLPTKGDVYVLTSAAAITGIAVLALFGADQLFGTHVFEGFKSFWSSHGIDVIVVAGTALGVAWIGRRMFQHVKQCEGSTSLTLLAITIVALSALYYADHLFNTHMTDDFSNFWKTSGVNVAIMSAGLFAVCAIGARIYHKNGIHSGDKKVLMAIALLAISTIGVLYSIDSIYHTGIMTPFTAFWKTEWSAVLIMGAASSILTSLIAMISLVYREKKEMPTKILGSTLLLALVIGALFAPWGGGDVAEMVNNHTWASLAGVTIGSGVAAGLYVYNRFFADEYDSIVAVQDKFQ